MAISHTEASAGRGSVNADQPSNAQSTANELPPNGGAAAEQLQREIEHLEGRDFHLWSVALLVALVLATGICVLVLPSLIWRTNGIRLDEHYLPQAFFGFIVLVVLFNGYVFEQRRLLRRLRSALMRQLTRANQAESLAQVDVLTDTLNRRLLNSTLQREISRAERMHSALTLMMIDVDDFKSVNTRYGHLAGDRVLQDVARLLKTTFRASDTIIRYGGDEFVVLLSDTTEDQGRVAMVRLHHSVTRWNEHITVPGWRLTLSCGQCTYENGMTTDELVARADLGMYQEKKRDRRASSTGPAKAETQPVLTMPARRSW